MSMHLIRWVMFDVARRPPRMPDGHFRIWQYIAWDVNHAGARTYIDVPRLAENAWFPVDTVTRALRQFEREGRLELHYEDKRIVHWVVRRAAALKAVENAVQNLLNYSGKPVDRPILHPSFPDAGSGNPDGGPCQQDLTARPGSGFTSLPSLIRLLDPSLEVPVSEERRSASPSPAPNVRAESAEDRLDVKAFLSNLKASLDAPAPSSRRRRSL